MGALTYLLAASLATPSAAAAERIETWRAYIAEASQRFDVPVPWIERVMAAESGGRTSLNGRPIISPAGAIGLMQLMPRTWAEMRRAYSLGVDPHDPRDNILAGAAYLKAMHQRFGYPGLFGAYNAGPARYADHLATGRPLAAETIGYMAKVTQGIAEGPRQGPFAARPVLFAIVAAAAQEPASIPSPAIPARDPLFAVGARVSR